MRRALVVFAVIGSGVAAAAPVSLRYLAPANAGCPDEAAFRTLVAARLGSDPFTTDAPALVTVELRGKGETPAAVVTLEEPRGTARGRKTLDGNSSCDALATSAAITVALSVDPLLRRADPLPEPPPPAVIPPPVEPPPPAVVPPPLPAPVVETSSPWRWSLAAGAGVSAGAAVAPQPQLRVEARARGDLFSLALDARFGWPVSADLGVGRLTTTALLGGLTPCLHLDWFSGCADVVAGALLLDGSQLREPQSHAIFQLGLGLKAQLEIPLGARVALRAFAEAHGNVLRGAADVGAQRVWTAAPVSGGGGLAVVVYFDRPVTEANGGRNLSGDAR